MMKELYCGRARQGEALGSGCGSELENLARFLK